MTKAEAVPLQIVQMHSDCHADQKAGNSPIKVAIPTEVNRKAFPDSPGGLLSPGDNSTVYEPDRYASKFPQVLHTNLLLIAAHQKLFSAAALRDS